MAALGFDATTVVPDEGQMGAIPKGWYNALIEKSEVTPTKDGTGTKLTLWFKVLEGQYKDRKVIINLNIRNANSVAQNIALGQLSAICHAVGVLRADQSEQLHNLPMKIRVKVRVQEGYDDSNDITAYKNINAVVEEAGSTTTSDPLTVNVGFPPAPRVQMPTINQAPVQPMPTTFPGLNPAMPMLNPAIPTTAPAFPPTAAHAPEILGNAPPQAWAAPVAPTVQPQVNVAPRVDVGPVMLSAANGILYSDYIQAGWTDQQLIDNGYMQAPVTASIQAPSAAPAQPAAPQVQAASMAEAQAPAEFDPNSPPPWMQQAAAQ
jgi:hypothetical protein